jgi:hypothetical protein
MPLLEKYHQQYGDRFTLLAVNDSEPAEAVQAYVDELGLTFPVLLDPYGRIDDVYRVRAFPTTFFVDADGVIRFQHIGSLDENQLLGYLKELGVVE